MRIIVTGSEGLVGKNLCKYLRVRGHDVVGLDRETGCDLNDKDKTEVLFKKFYPQVVYHLAANASEARGQIEPINMIHNNVGIFANTLKAAINTGVKKFIFTSSIAVYGVSDHPYKEDDVKEPKDVYGVNKLACEQILKIMANVYSFNYTIFRPHNIYGPGQSMIDPSRNVVALFMRKLIENEPYKLFGDGKMKRAFSYVDDVVLVLMKALQPQFNNLTMNVGSTHPIEIRTLSTMLQEITGITANVEQVPGRPQEIVDFLADHSLQDKMVAYKNTSLEKGLKETWEWVKKQKLLPLIKKEDEIYV